VVKEMLVTTAVLMVAVIAAAEEKPATGKDMCLLAVKYCPNGEDYNIVEKYDRLKAEIAKVPAVYSPEELTHLKKSMKRTEETLTLLGIGCH
jgi:hypothetical protein